MSEISLNDAIDWQAIYQIRSYLAQALDQRDWSLFEDQFLDEVQVDFSDMGVAPQRVSRQDLRANYQQNLSRPGLRTQHLFTDVRITIMGDTAHCVTSFAGHHFLAGMAGGEEYVLRGEYTDQLVRTPHGWKITALIFRTAYHSGNPALLAP